MFNKVQIRTISLKILKNDNKSINFFIEKFFSNKNFMTVVVLQDFPL